MRETETCWDDYNYFIAHADRARMIEALALSEFPEIERHADYLESVKKFEAMIDLDLRHLCAEWFAPGR